MWAPTRKGTVLLLKYRKAYTNKTVRRVAWAQIDLITICGIKIHIKPLSNKTRLTIILSCIFLCSDYNESAVS